MSDAPDEVGITVVIDVVNLYGDAGFSEVEILVDDPGILGIFGLLGPSFVSDDVTQSSLRRALLFCRV